MQLKTGNEYWLLTDLEHTFIIGATEYYALKLCVLDFVDIENYGIRFIFFEKENPTIVHSFIPNELEQWLYNSPDEYLRYLVEHINSLNNNEKENKHKYKFDDFMKQKVLESQEQHPEIWI